MPPITPMASLFGRNPFKSLQQHMRASLECAQEVPSLFDALSRGDSEALKATMEKIFEKENAADDLKNQMRMHLPKSLFMPVDRRDLLEILQMQDSIADTAQDIAGLLVERPMEFPQPLVQPTQELTQRCVDVCEMAAKIIEELDELVETGFRGKQMTKVEQMMEALNRAENETDDQGLLLTRLLFSHEDDMKPVSVMMWYQIIQWIGDLADYAEKVGDRLRLLIAK